METLHATLITSGEGLRYLRASIIKTSMGNASIPKVTNGRCLMDGMIVIQKASTTIVPILGVFLKKGHP
jgi:hypothetical protein